MRLEALRLLALNYPTEVADVLQTAMNDSYELIRRYAVEYVEKELQSGIVAGMDRKLSVART